MQILNDFQTSVAKALSEIDSKWRDYDGLIICGTHQPNNLEYMLDEIRKAREAGTPFLGICFGHQIAAVEYARNVLGQTQATSEEFADSTLVEDFIVKKLPQLKVGLHDTSGLYMGEPIGGQTYWNNYEVVPDFESMWKKADNFITCQYHPEYQSSKDKPHPLLIKFIEYARGKSKGAV